MLGLCPLWVHRIVHPGWGSGLFVIFLDHGGYKSDLWLELEAMAGGGWAGGQAGRQAEGQASGA